MIHKNKYINNSKFSKAKFREVVKYFVADLSATQIATLSGISRNSINKYVMEIRHRIYAFYNSESPFIALSDVELDKSYFGARRVRGKRGRGAYVKNIVFGWR